jgi:hypothetical protein
VKGIEMSGEKERRQPGTYSEIRARSKTEVILEYHIRASGNKEYGTSHTHHYNSDYRKCSSDGCCGLRRDEVRLSGLWRKVTPWPRSTWREALSLSAEVLYQDLKSCIERAGSRIGKNEQLSVYFIAGSVWILVDEIGYYAQDLITISGSDAGGAKTQVLSHCNSVQLIMKITPQSQPPKQRQIGFIGRVQ